MASLRRLPNSRNWIACFTDSHGKRLQRSTGTSSRSAALQIAHKFEEAARRMKTEAQIRRVLSDIYEGISGTQLPSGSVGTFFEGWIVRKRAETADRTVRSYESIIKQFREHLGPKDASDLSYITPADVLSFRDALMGRVGPTTVNHSIKVLTVALNQAKREGLIQVNPALHVSRIKRSSGGIERRPFTLQELERILAVADEEWKGLVLFGLYTGQRLGDVGSLTWSNIDTERGEVRLLTGKTKRRMIIPMAPALSSYVAGMKVGDIPGQPLFPRAAEILKRQKRPGTLSNQFYDLLVAAGLAKKRSHQAKGTGRSGKRELNEISFHCLRHTATSLLKNAGVSDVVAREFVGHESEAVSRQYTHIETSTLRDALKRLPNLLS